MPDQIQINKQMDERVGVLEVRVNRIESDIESEKATRARATTELHTRFDRLDDRMRSAEKLIAMAGGAIALLQIISWFR